MRRSASAQPGASLNVAGLPRRLAVVAVAPGDGCSTVARELAEAMDVPVVEALAEEPGVLDAGALDATRLNACASAEGVVLVVRAGRTTATAAGAAARALDDAGAKVVGVVVNDPDREFAGHVD